MMKMMTCKQLGGSCDLEFRAETFEGMKELSQQHGKKMFEENDAVHLAAMQKMREQMQKPDAMSEWMAAREKEFDALAEN